MHAPLRVLQLTTHTCDMTSHLSSTALAWRRFYLNLARLKASSRTSGLLSGFAMVAMVELQMDSGRLVPDPLLIVYAVCTTLLVTIHLTALMISTCILPNMEAVSNDKAQEDSKTVNESPHDKMRLCIEIAWVCSTALGIILFLAELGVLCWVKFFYDSPNAAIAATVIIIPAGVAFAVFALVFYRKLVAHKYERQEEVLRELHDMAHDLQGDGDAHRLDIV